MTPYHLIRIILWMLLVIMAVLIVKKNSNGKNLKLIIVIISVVIVVLDVIPVENLLFNFKSPEKAFWYATGDKVQSVIEGNDSVFVVGESNTDILMRQGDGFAVDNKAYHYIHTQYSDGLLIQVCEKNNSSDVYVVVSPDKDNNVPLTDSFRSSYQKEFFARNEYPSFVAYIGKSLDGYLLIVNGKTISLTERNN